MAVKKSYYRITVIHPDDYYLDETLRDRNIKRKFHRKTLYTFIPTLLEARQLVDTILVTDSEDCSEGARIWLGYQGADPPSGAHVIIKLYEEWWIKDGRLIQTKSKGKCLFDVVYNLRNAIC